MVADIEPVADVQPVAVHRQGLAGDRVMDHQRDQLFRKLPRTVVVRAVGRQRGQPVGVAVRAHQMIGTGLRGRVGTVRSVGRRLGKRRIVGTERAVHFVSRHMQQTEARALGLRQCAPIGAGRLEQRKRADDVGLDELGRSVNRAIDMALGREIEHGPRPVHRQQRLDLRAIADVAADEQVPRIPFQRGEVAQVAGVGKLVEIDDRLFACRAPVEDEVGADEAGASGDQNHRSISCRRGANSITRWKPARRRRNTRDTTRRSATALRRAASSARIPSRRRGARSTRKSPARPPAAAADIP